ncbi:MAG: Swt1 family HEPN domain-containing protein, partial [Terriglobia bacterium]
MIEMDLYSFVYRGVLTEEALDRTGRRRRSHFGADRVGELQQSLSFDFLDSELLVEGQRMSVVYAAVHAFENTVRAMVTKAMGEKHGPTWWEKVPERIQKTSKSRMEEDAKFRWH